ncbi:MAG: hypothetical protein J1E62_05775 [Lachnospiraceae bacterium]|nr:hypothetical protein [Lachnospiraceae bacterium]
MITWEEFTELIRSQIPNRELAKSVEIMPETRLIEDLEYDSIAIVELLSKIEEDYGVDYTTLPDFLERVNVCRDIYEGIQELL